MKTIDRLLGLFVTGLVLLSTMYACSDSFLEGPAQGTLDENVLATQNGVEGNLIAAYSMLDGYGEFGGWGTAASNWVFGSVASDNAYKGSEPGDQQPISDIEFYQWGTSGTDDYVNDKWRSLYESVNRSNATLELLNTVDDISQSDRERIQGEARFLRAHYHFEAWKMWENIPYYTEEDEDFRKPNVGANPIAKILEDLDKAINLLPPLQSDIGRVTEWTAKAYKGKVQVYSEDFSGALTTLREVVNNGPYELEDNFWKVFSAGNDNGSETILAYQASANDGDTNGNNGNYPDRLNFPHGGSPFGCCGFHQPSQNLVNAFQVDGNGLPLALSDNTWNSLDTDPGSSVPVDPRLDWTVGRDNVPYLDWGPHQPGWIRDRSWAGPYSPKKNIYEKNSDVQSSVGWANYQLHAKNVHLFRYADVMLLLAEAEVEAGDLENARDLVNQIRERAAVAAQGPTDNIEVDPQNPSITWADYEIGTYDTPWTDQEFARQAVRTERRLELAMEGHRFFDLRRWGTAQQVLNDYLEIEKTRREYLTGADQYSERNRLYPIPSVQIELSTVNEEERLKQNKGW